MGSSPVLAAFHAASAPVQQRVQQAPAMSSRSSRQETASSVSISRQQPSRLSKAELACLSVKELKQMLSDRGVGQGNASEKSELVEWVHAHQELNVKSKKAKHEPASKNALAQLSVVELHRMLAVRGVAPGNASEKSELVEWVYQHQNLPVIRPEAEHEDRQKCKRTASSSARALRGNEVAVVEQPAADVEDEAEEELKRLGPSD